MRRVPVARASRTAVAADGTSPAPVVPARRLESAASPRNGAWQLIRCGNGAPPQLGDASLVRRRRVWCSPRFCRQPPSAKRLGVRMFLSVITRHARPECPNAKEMTNTVRLTGIKRRRRWFVGGREGPVTGREGVGRSDGCTLRGIGRRQVHHPFWWSGFCNRCGPTLHPAPQRAHLIVVSGRERGEERLGDPTLRRRRHWLIV